MATATSKIEKVVCDAKRAYWQACRSYHDWCDGRISAEQWMSDAKKARKVLNIAERLVRRAFYDARCAETRDEKFRQAEMLEDMVRDLDRQMRKG